MIEDKYCLPSTQRAKLIFILCHAHECPVACSFFIFLRYLRLSLPVCEGELRQERRCELAACHRAEGGRGSLCHTGLSLDCGSPACFPGISLHPVNV